MKPSILLNINIAVIVSATGAQAAIIFDADLMNTTIISNNVSSVANGNTLSGSAGGLIFTNINNGNNNSGFASSTSVNTLNGAAITVDDVVTFTFEVSSISPGNLTANGIEFGFVGGPTPGFRSDDDLLFQIDNDGNTSSIAAAAGVGINAGLGDIGLGFTEASVVDGFTATLTLDAAGFSFEIQDVLESTGVNQAFTGSFASSNDFLDAVGNGHLYITAQKTANPDLIINFEEVSIDVTTVPEPSSSVILGLAGTLLLFRRAK